MTRHSWSVGHKQPCGIEAQSLTPYTKIEQKAVNNKLLLQGKTLLPHPTTVHRGAASWSSRPTTNIPSRKKKRAIVQQTIGITDNVAVHQCVHYRPVYALQYILQSLWTKVLIRCQLKKMGLGVNQKLRRFWVLTCWWLPYSDAWESKRSRNLRMKANLQDGFLSWVTCYLLDVQDLAQHVQGLRMISH